VSAGRPDSARAWSIAIAAVVANAACWGTMNSFGAFLDSMTDEFDASLGATALIYALPSFILFVLGSVTGPLADQHGPRRMLLAGALLTGTGLLITSQAPNLGVAILAYGLGLGLGMACFLVPMTACIGGWFVRRRAVAQGLSAAGSGLGTLLVVPFARWLIDEFGWRRAYEVLAAMCVGALLIAAAIAARPPNRQPAGRPSLRRMREAAGAGPFRELYAGGFLLSSALFVPFVFLVRYATDHGITKRDAALLLSILGASNIVCRLVATGLASRFGAVRVYMTCFLSLPLGLCLWLVAGGSYVTLAIFAVVLGVSHGGTSRSAPRSPPSSSASPTSAPSSARCGPVRGRRGSSARSSPATSSTGPASRPRSSPPWRSPASPSSPSAASGRRARRCRREPEHTGLPSAAPVPGQCPTLRRCRG
jgi:MFS family permease